MIRNKLGLAAVVVFFSMPLCAQWLNEPTRGIPRTADGKADLSAPAPRTAEGRPDLTGLWLAPLHPGYIINVAADLDPAEVRPWAAQAFNAHLDDLGKDDPGTIGCQPLGPRHITGDALVRMAKIVQTPAVIVVLYEDMNYRQIFMDGRSLPKNPSPSFMGYSVGSWEGDELVVESAGFKDTTWLDFGGHPRRNAFGIRTAGVVPLSQNMFSPRLLGTYEFVTDDGGVVTHIMVHGVESTEKRCAGARPNDCDL